MSAQPKRGRGRPLKPAAARKRNNLTIRVRDALKANLESRAQENQRSLSEEAEFRLEGSFADQGYLEQMQEQLGGATTYALLMILGRVMRETGITARLMSPPTDKQDVNDWHRHPYSYDQVAKSVIAVLQALRPPGEVTPPHKFAVENGAEVMFPVDLNTLRTHLGENFARIALSSVADPTNAPTADLQKWGKLVRDVLDKRE